MIVTVVIVTAIVMVTIAVRIAVAGISPGMNRVIRHDDPRRADWRRHDDGRCADRRRQYDRRGVDRRMRDNHVRQWRQRQTDANTHIYTRVSRRSHSSEDQC